MMRLFLIPGELAVDILRGVAFAIAAALVVMLAIVAVGAYLIARPR
jgi:hypothetical protein